MEAVLLVLVGAILFSHSWYLLGLYTEGKSMGLVNAALAVGLGAVALGMFAPITMPLHTSPANPAVIATQVYAVLWAVYGAGVAAHGLWDYEERAIGFFSLFVAAASLVYLVGLTAGGFSAEQAPGSTIALLAGSSLLLGALATVVFVHLGIPFRGLRPVAGWFLLVGSIIVALLGFGILFNLIRM